MGLNHASRAENDAVVVALGRISTEPEQVADAERTEECDGGTSDGGRRGDGPAAPMTMPPIRGQKYGSSSSVTKAAAAIP